MAEVLNSRTDGDNLVYDVGIEGEDGITLQTADTYVDKNIIFNINLQNLILDCGTSTENIY